VEENISYICLFREEKMTKKRWF